MRDIELMVTGAATYIQNNFATYLSAISTAAGDGIDLGAPTYSTGYKDIFGRTKYPAILFVPDYIEQEPSGAGCEWLSVHMDILSVITASKPDVLTTKLMRYIDAMCDLVRENETLGGACLTSEFVGSDFLPGPAGAEDIGVVVISIKLTKEVRT